jgi:hypothetical protein
LVIEDKNAGLYFGMKPPPLGRPGEDDAGEGTGAACQAFSRNARSSAENPSIDADEEGFDANAGINDGLYFGMNPPPLECPPLAGDGAGSACHARSSPIVFSRNARDSGEYSSIDAGFDSIVGRNTGLYFGMYPRAMVELRAPILPRNCGTTAIEMLGS